MIWLTWRQFRMPTIVMTALVGAFSLVLLASGPHLVTLARNSGFAACHSHCAQDAGNFLNGLDAGTPYHLIFLLGALLIILLPGVIGLFWGAPLIARELETGTYRLAWNQSVTRERWLAAKLGIVGLAGMALAGLLSLFLGWWGSPIERATALNATGGFQDRFFPIDFGTRGIAPIGYAAFAFALGVLVGLLIRRTVPAMGITLAVVLAVQIVFPLAIRPHLISPVRSVTTVTAGDIQGLSISGSPNGSNQQIQNVFVGQPNVPASAWVISSRVTTASGSSSLGAMPQVCAPSANSGPNACFSALANKHLKAVVTYQPGNRYWTFQSIESGIYLTAAILLAWACFWMIRRRLS
jgi:ABC-type transport system involved in multi-copper enzyme maturation permease subunit